MENLARLIFGKPERRRLRVLKIDTSWKRNVTHVAYSENEPKLREPDAPSAAIDLFEAEWILQELHAFLKLDHSRNHVLDGNPPPCDCAGSRRDKIEISKSEWDRKVFRTLLKLSRGNFLSFLGPPSIDEVLVGEADTCSSGYDASVDTNVDSTGPELSNENSPLGSDSSADSALVATELDDEKRMSRLEDRCEKLEKRVKELVAERDAEMSRRRDSESSLQMAKQEYARVISNLEAKGLHETRQRYMLRQTVQALRRANRSISSQLADSGAERDAILLQLSELLPAEQQCGGTHVPPLADKTALRDRFEVFLNKMKTENRALEDEASNLRQKVDQLSLFNNHYCEELETKENNLKVQYNLIESQKTTIELLKKKNRVTKDQLLANAFKRMDNIVSVKTELEILKTNNQENDAKLQKEISELKSIIESSHVQLGQRTESCDGCAMLNELTTENNALKVKESDLKKEVEALRSDRNDLREQLQARDSQMECLNSDVVTLIYNLDLALAMVKVAVTD